ncbi:MAG: biotin--[acetyl-CoA-carboxylase] ligase [Chloroflexota bacterium]|nr:biotin--[acetyl-CoA-carboxylase] ligase [Chloroflexota bacterium]MDE2969176.1 biotin--[acetyl-CoA-carboxylase] ligase [Chloroflexota bacterium]
MTAERLTAREIKRGLSTAVIGVRVRCRQSVASTMDAARRLAEQGAPEGTVVLAERQTRGRGRFNREWVSPPGLNLTLSIVLRPQLERMRTLNMAASVALVDTIRAATGLDATVKWPNDVRVDRRKVAGILIEARTGAADGYAILGVGLNVNHDPTPSLTPPAEATSLAAATGRPVDRLAVLQAFLRALDAPDADAERLFQRWRGMLDTLGQRVRVAWGGDGATVAEGVAVDVTPEGDLVLRREDGSTVTLNAGEVTVIAGTSI